MSGVTYQVSLVTFHVLHVVCYMPLTTKAMDPPSDNSPTMHGRTVCGDPKSYFFPLGYFRPLKVLWKFNWLFNFSVRNIFLIIIFDLGPLTVRVKGLYKNIYIIVWIVWISTTFQTSLQLKDWISLGPIQ